MKDSRRRVLNFEIYFPKKESVFRGFLSTRNLIVEWSGAFLYSFLNLIHFHMNALTFPWVIEEILRANFCKYRESGDSFKIFNFLIFCPNKAFSELFSKIQLKDPKALEFFQNRGKFENRHFGLPPPLKIDENDAFSFRSCW